MTDDDRPSIAELKRIAATGYGWPNQAAIALALKDAYGAPDRERETLTIMFRALAKVRP